MIDETYRRKARIAYEKMNDSPMQRRLRDRSAFYSAVVYHHPGDYQRTVLEREFRRILDAGFTAVRFHTSSPRWDAEKRAFDFTRSDDWLAVAEEVGIDVIQHISLSRPDDSFLAAHGVSSEQWNQDHLDTPEMRKIAQAWMGPMLQRYAERSSIIGYELLGEPGAGAGRIDNDYDRLRFAQWLRDTYGDIESLDAAWNIYPQRAQPIAASFEDALQLLEGFDAAELISGVHRAKMNYGAGRDVLRYLTDKSLSRARVLADVFRQFDRQHPILMGSHQLQINPASLDWDFGRWARIGDQHFCSLHLPWHFELVEGEVDRPVLMQAKQTRDYFKGGWTSAFETIGGAVQYSGGYGAGMTAGLLRRHIVSYLAAGNLSMAFWTWNHRPGGWEAGEYGLTSLSGRLTDWGLEAGKISRAAKRFARELWQAEPETRVALMEVWDTDAVLCFEPERHDLADVPGGLARGTRTQAIRARIGAARALINQHVPYEYLPDHELAEGIAEAYPAIYVPHARAISDRAIAALQSYVENGGRLIADVQFAFMDPWGKLHAKGAGTAMEKLFGAWVDVIHDSRTAPMSINGGPIEGFFGDLILTDARPVMKFQDGRPAVAENRIGKGSAVLLGFDAARMCHRPGRQDIEQLIGDLARGGSCPTWRCTAPIVVRRATDEADHYFLVNDGASRFCIIEAFDRKYRSGLDVIDDRAIEVDGTIAIELPERSAMWVRLAHA
ncbi:MAG: beta-galactosidase trimerization domain-containing protein [Phycisphaeraceae bacterium]|nr:beta-galactosidase trimerization domain-containing protein [Phycisphaeraceae bacterium]